MKLHVVALLIFTSSSALAGQCALVFDLPFDYSPSFADLRAIERTEDIIDLPAFNQLLTRWNLPQDNTGNEFVGRLTGVVQSQLEAESSRQIVNILQQYGNDPAIVASRVRQAVDIRNQVHLPVIINGRNRSATAAYIRTV